MQRHGCNKSYTALAGCVACLTGMDLAKCKSSCVLTPTVPLNLHCLMPVHDNLFCDWGQGASASGQTLILTRSIKVNRLQGTMSWPHLQQPHMDASGRSRQGWDASRSPYNARCITSIACMHDTHVRKDAVLLRSAHVQASSMRCLVCTLCAQQLALVRHPVHESGRILSPCATAW
jgi:hypothetical protein